MGYTRILTWSGFEAAKPAPWPSRGFHHVGKFLETSDEIAGRGCYCFLLPFQFQFQHFRCLSGILATSCIAEGQTQLFQFHDGIVLGFCLLDTECMISTEGWKVDVL